MPKKSTNELIDLILDELMSYPWTEHFQEVSDMDPSVGRSEPVEDARRAGFLDVARSIAQAVR